MTNSYQPSPRTRAVLGRLSLLTESALERHEFLRALIPNAPSSWAQWDALPQTCSDTYQAAVGALYHTRNMEALPLPLSPVDLSRQSPTMIPLGHAERAHAAARLARGLRGLGCPRGASVGVIAATSRRYLASDVVDSLQAGGHEARLMLVHDDCGSSDAVRYLFGSRYLVWLHTASPDVGALPSSLCGLITLDYPFFTTDRMLHGDFKHSSAVPFFALRCGSMCYAPPDDVFVESGDNGVPMVTPLYEAAVPLVRFVPNQTNRSANPASWDKTSLVG